MCRSIPKVATTKDARFSSAEREETESHSRSATAGDASENANRRSTQALREAQTNGRAGVRDHQSCVGLPPFSPSRSRKSFHGMVAGHTGVQREAAACADACRNGLSSTSGAICAVIFYKNQPRRSPGVRSRSDAASRRPIHVTNFFTSAASPAKNRRAKPDRLLTA